MIFVTVKLQKFVMNEPFFSPLGQGSNWEQETSKLVPVTHMTSALRRN